MNGYDTDLELNVDDLFKDPVEDQETNQTNTTDDKTVEEQEKQEMTKGVSKRINEVRHKTEIETEDRIAKQLGYDSYDALLKSKEKEMLQEAGVDNDEVSAMVEKLVEERLKRDPRLKKLEEIESLEKTKFVEAQLNAINQFSDNKYTSVDELPKEVLSIWEKTGDLKQAYLAVKGEELLLKNKSSSLNGSTNHLANPGSVSGSSKTRLLTAEEKEIYRSVLGDFYNEEEISKKTRPIK